MLGLGRDRAAYSENSTGALATSFLKIGDRLWMQRASGALFYYLDGGIYTMGYRKRKSSRTLEQAEIRAAGLAAIDPKMDFGSDRSLSNLQAQINQLQGKINAYNTALTTVDNLRSDIKDCEKTLADLSDRMLIGVAFQYGKDSAEYEMAGGVRKQERIRRSTIARIRAEEDAAV